MGESRKLNVGLFCFSCCEDSSIVFTEMLNDNFFEWRKLINFKHARILRSLNELSDLDVAFVEGAIASEKDREKLRQIRANSKKLVAIGACACTGMPSAQRNDFDDQRKEVIQVYIEHFDLLGKVEKVEDVVRVDDKVPGCPMVEKKFLDVLNKYLEEFGVVHNA